MKLQLKISCRQLIYLLLFAIVFTVPLLERLDTTRDNVLFALQFIALLICSIKMFVSKRFVFDKYWMFFLLFVAWCFFVIVYFTSTGGLYRFVRGSAYSVIAVYVICNAIFERDFSTTIKYIAKYYAVLIWLNFLSMLIWRKGIIQSSVGAINERANWIFGSKNNVVYIMPLLLFLFGVDRVLNKKNRYEKVLRIATYVLMIVSFSSMAGYGFSFLSGSSTAILMIIGYIAMKLLIDRKRESKLVKGLSIRSICIFSFVIMIFVAVISQGVLTGNQNIFTYITSLFGKNIGFSGRYSVWRQAIKAVFDSPIYGIGLKREIFITYNNFNSTNTSIYSFWLTILVRYGIVGLILMFLAFCFSEDGERDSVIKTQAYISFILMMFGGLTYPLEWKYVFLITTIYHIGYKKLKGNDRDDKKRRAVSR